MHIAYEQAANNPAVYSRAAAPAVRNESGCSRRIIFLDIDGTFTLPGSNEAPPSAALAVRQARSRGNLVFLCSGRNEGMLAPVLQYGFDGYISCSGGRIVCGGEVIYDRPMSAEQQRRAEEILRANGIYVTVECRSGSYTDEAFKEFLRTHAAEGSNSELLRWRRQIESSLGILPMREYCGEPVYKMVLMMTDRRQLEEPIRQLGSEFAFCIPGRDGFGIVNAEMVGKGVDKGRAVELVCEHLRIPLADSVAFGDSMNDREMMQTAGFSVCMENGSADLKRMADAVCPAVDRDGLAQAFARYGLSGQSQGN